MNFKKIINFILICLLFIVLGCENEEKEENRLILSGQIEIDENIDYDGEPLFLYIGKGDGFSLSAENADESSIGLYNIDNADRKFSLNLSDKKIKSDDKVTIAAFIDKNYDGNIPLPDKGDFAGFYLDTDKMSTDLVLKNGINNLEKIKVNREVFSFEKRIKGKIKGDYKGDVIVFAYAGEINSLSFDNINSDKIVAYKVFNKTDINTDLPYSLDILPYGFDLPINNLYILAFYDSNNNGKTDEGDFIGYHAENKDSNPDLIDIVNENDEVTDVDIYPIIEVKKSSEDIIEISGSLNISESIKEIDFNKPVFLIVSKADSSGTDFSSPDKIKYFEKVDFNGEKIDYFLDLTDTDLCKGDEVVVSAIFDKDYVNGFPKLTKGDFIGLYYPKDKVSSSLSLKKGKLQNNGIDLVIEKKIWDLDISVSGKVISDETGEASVFAYSGEIVSSDFSSFDPKDVIGFTSFDKNSKESQFNFDILPFFNSDPVKKFYLISIIDKDDNKKINAGDLTGFHTKSDINIPEFVNINSTNEKIENKDIKYFSIVNPDSEESISISGKLSLPDDYNNGDLNKPIFILVSNARAENIEQPDPDNIKYFQKFVLSEENIKKKSFDYSMDISTSGLNCGDKVMISVLWDLNNDGGFPSSDPGDKISFYQQPEKSDPSYVLKCTKNTDINLCPNRIVYDYEKKIKGKVKGEVYGDITIIAYAGEIDSLSFKNINFDKIIGYKKITNKAKNHDLEYSLDLLPYGFNLPIENVYVLGFFDQNRDGKLNKGDYIGYHKGYNKSNPNLINIPVTKSDIYNIDVVPVIEYIESSPDIIDINGVINLLDNFNDTDYEKPLFLIISKADELSFKSVTPENIVFIKKIDNYNTNDRIIPYDIDLTDTYLSDGDEVIVSVLFDLDYVNGFPELTKGDYIGNHYPKKKISPAIVLSKGSGVNSGIDINVDKKVFDYETSVSGKLTGTANGNAFIIAYNDDIKSSDFSLIDPSKVIGYQRVLKDSGTTDYKMDIIPFGEEIPLNDVFIMAVLDTNLNNIVDYGDKTGFHKNNYSGLPALLPISSQPINDVNISLYTDVPEPGLENISLKGAFTASGYITEDSKPFYIVVSDAYSSAISKNNYLNNVRFFQKVDPGEFYFDMDLKSSGLLPGNKVMIAALWDRDFNGRYLNPTKKDMLGVLQNKDSYSLMMALNYGENSIPTGEYEFKVNKNVYDFSSSISYALDKYNTADYNDRSQIMVMTIHVDGVDFNYRGSNTTPEIKIDMDYVLSFNNINPVDFDYSGPEADRTDPEIPRNADIIKYLYNKIEVYPDSDPLKGEPLIKSYDEGQEQESTAYLVAILDKDGDFLMDDEDEIGYYGQTIESGGDTIIIPGVGEFENPVPGQTYFIPQPIKRILKGKNEELRQSGEHGPYWIKMNAATNTN